MARHADGARSRLILEAKQGGACLVLGQEKGPWQGGSPWMGLTGCPQPSQGTGGWGPHGGPEAPPPTSAL